MKILVIHPKDTTTDFLSEIYSDKDWSVITDNVSKSFLTEQIILHDRIVMLGHGSDLGLYGHNRMMIDSTLVYLLRSKQCVCVWCNANVFVEKYNLKGFYTGMIISDDVEASAYDIECSLNDIEISNITLAWAIKNYLDDDIPIEIIRNNYDSDLNEVIKYNRNNLYYV